MIRYIVHTISSLRDINGNCYHIARVTSVISGKSIHLYDNGQNAAYHIRGISGHDTVYVVQSWEKKAEWKRLCKARAPERSAVTAELLASLDNGVNR